MAKRVPALIMAGNIKRARKGEWLSIGLRCIPRMLHGRVKMTVPKIALPFAWEASPKSADVVKTTYKINASRAA